MSESALLGEPHVFDAVLEPLEWGRSTYVVVRLPVTVVDAAAACGTRRLAGRVDDVDVNLAITRADVIEDPFLWAGAGLRRRLGARPGDVVTCRLAPVDPDHVPVPPDVREAVAAAGVEPALASLRPAELRQRLVPVEDAVRPATRARRVADLVASLR
jgi:hypothetical protein